VVLLVALPVATVVGAVVAFATTEPTSEQKAEQALGRADLAVFTQGSQDDAAIAGLRDDLPEGTRFEFVRRGVLTLSGNGARTDVAALGANLNDLAQGMLELVDGRAPRVGGSPPEIALTSGILRTLEASIGSTIEAHGVGEVVVVGVVRDPLDLERKAAVVLPDVVSDASKTLLVSLSDPGSSNDLSEAVRKSGLRSLSRADTSSASTQEGAIALVLGGLVFFEVALVAGAAFAVSARRRQRDLALLAASGAHPGHTRTAVLISGAILGALGAGLGLVLGLVSVWLARPGLQRWSGQVVDDLRIPGALVVTGVALGFVSAVMAAWFPARAAARMPVLLALAGRRPSSKPSHRWLAFGAVVSAAGLGILVAAPFVLANVGGGILVGAGLLLGAVCVLLGFGATSPWILDQLGRLAPRLPLAPRLALRDAARFRSRNGAVITAVLASLAISVAVGGTLETMERNNLQSYQPLLAEDQLLIDGPAADQVVQRLLRELPVAAAAPVTRTLLLPPGEMPSGSEPVVTVGSTEVLQAIGADSAAVAALEAGEVVVIDGGEDQPREEHESIEILRGEAPIHRIKLDTPTQAVAGVIVTRYLLRDLGYTVPAEEHGAWLVRLEGSVTREDLGQARGIAAGFTQTTVSVEEGPPDTLVFERTALVISVVTALACVAIALALAAAETRPDQQTLLAVGADPRLRRIMAAGRALLLSAIGALLAVPAGLLPVWGLNRSDDATAGSIAIPWDTIAIVAIGVPCVAAAGAWALTRPRRSSSGLRTTVI
jgi:putative ABC transport system permease protein